MESYSFKCGCGAKTCDCISNTFRHMAMMAMAPLAGMPKGFQELMMKHPPPPPPRFQAIAAPIVGVPMSKKVQKKTSTGSVPPRVMGPPAPKVATPKSVQKKTSTGSVPPKVMGPPAPKVAMPKSVQKKTSTGSIPPKVMGPPAPKVAMPKTVQKKMLTESVATPPTPRVQGTSAPKVGNFSIFPPASGESSGSEFESEGEAETPILPVKDKELSLTALLEKPLPEIWDHDSADSQLMPIFCEDCNETFSSRFMYVMHFRNVHGECEECGTIVDEESTCIFLADMIICDICRERKRRTRALARGATETVSKEPNQRKSVSESDSELEYELSKMEVCIGQVEKCDWDDSDSEFEDYLLGEEEEGEYEELPLKVEMRTGNVRETKPGNLKDLKRSYELDEEEEEFEDDYDEEDFDEEDFDEEELEEYYNEYGEEELGEEESYDEELEEEEYYDEEMEEEEDFEEEMEEEEDFDEEMEEEEDYDEIDEEDSRR